MREISKAEYITILESAPHLMCGTILKHVEPTLTLSDKHKEILEYVTKNGTKQGRWTSLFDGNLLRFKDEEGNNFHESFAEEDRYYAEETDYGTTVAHDPVYGSVLFKFIPKQWDEELLWDTIIAEGRTFMVQPGY